MAIQLANDEKIIKEWDFSSEQAASKTSLVVTDKRVVMNSQGRTKESAAIVRNEVGLEDVKGVSASYSYTKTRIKGLFVLGIILLAVALLCFVLAIVAREEDITTFLALFAICAVLGIILLYLKKKDLVFVLSIISSPMALTMNVVNNPMCILDTKNNAASVFSIAISEDKAKEIIDTIGAAVLANK